MTSHKSTKRQKTDVLEELQKMVLRQAGAQPHLYRLPADSMLLIVDYLGFFPSLATLPTTSRQLMQTPAVDEKAAAGKFLIAPRSGHHRVFRDVCITSLQATRWFGPYHLHGWMRSDNPRSDKVLRAFRLWGDRTERLELDRSWYALQPIVESKVFPNLERLCLSKLDDLVRGRDDVCPWRHDVFWKTLLTAFPRLHDVEWHRTLHLPPWHYTVPGGVRTTRVMARVLDDDPYRTTRRWTRMVVTVESYLYDEKGWTKALALQVANAGMKELVWTTDRDTDGARVAEDAWSAADVASLLAKLSDDGDQHPLTRLALPQDVKEGDEAAIVALLTRHFPRLTECRFGRAGLTVAQDAWLAALDACPALFPVFGATSRRDIRFLEGAFSRVSLERLVSRPRAFTALEQTTSDLFRDWQADDWRRFLMCSTHWVELQFTRSTTGPVVLDEKTLMWAATHCRALRRLEMRHGEAHLTDAVVQRLLELPQFDSLDMNRDFYLQDFRVGAETPYPELNLTRDTILRIFERLQRVSLHHAHVTTLTATQWKELGDWFMDPWHKVQPYSEFQFFVPLAMASEFTLGDKGRRVRGERSFYAEEWPAGIRLEFVNEGEL